MGGKNSVSQIKHAQGLSNLKCVYNMIFVWYNIDQYAPE